MAPSNNLTARIEALLTARTERSVRVLQADAIGGGSINDAYRIGTNAGRYFLKVNSADRFPSMFEAEADGLRRLREAHAVRAPAVIAFGEEADEAFLLLEHIEDGARGRAFWERFGQALAALHRNTHSHFGLERDNYIGSLKQVNTPTADWAAFFIRHRLEPMVKMARDTKRTEAGMAFRFERLFGKLEWLFPKEPPALLHGDLWNGNFLSGPGGEPVLIDPAVYYGHREMDIAMTMLFGGFDAGFHTAYNAAWPMELGWEERVELCNLSPLLVHANLFGGGYPQKVEAVLRRHT